MSTRLSSIAGWRLTVHRRNETVKDRPAIIQPVTDLVLESIGITDLGHAWQDSLPHGHVGMVAAATRHDITGRTIVRMTPKVALPESMVWRRGVFLLKVNGATALTLLL
jgi:hypothetical protein